MPIDFPHPVYSRHVLQPVYTDAQRYLFEPMLAAHEAHALMLAECSIISNALHIYDSFIQISSITPSQLTLEVAQAAAQEVLGRPLDLEEEAFQRSLHPGHFVAVRAGLGSVAPQATGALLADLAAELQADSHWLADVRDWLQIAEERRRRAVQALLDEEGESRGLRRSVVGE